MKILVTGCSGFIGWRVSQRLLEDGHTVTGVDNLNSTYDVRLKRWRLDALKKHSTFQFNQIDITDLDGLRPLFQDQPDAVVNLAARAGVRQSLANPWGYLHANVTGTLNLLDLCREHGVAKMVLASTSSLYGANTERPFREDANTDWPLSPYAASKKGAETLCYTYHHLFGVDVTVLRYFTVYGPAGRPDMSIFRFIKWISEGEPLIVYGDGSQERDFTYLDDVARATVSGLRPVGYDIINIGSDRPVPIMGVIKLLSGMLGKEPRIEFQPAHASDPYATWANISKAERLLGWVPQTTLDLGLEKAVEWYQQNRSWAREVRLA